MDIQEELKNLPYYLNQRFEVLCPECGKTYITKQIDYELQLDIVPNSSGNRFRLYYRANNYGLYDKDKYIGENFGLGFKTLEEAIADLKNVLTAKSLI